jgi:hypothetical protein
MITLRKKMSKKIDVVLDIVGSIDQKNTTEDRLLIKN